MASPAGRAGVDVRPAGFAGRVKNRVITPGARPRMIRTGVFRGLWMQLDLRDHTQVFLGLYERELHKWVRALGERAVSAIDVGAADGAYSLYFLKRTGMRAVHAFEPDPAARGTLLTNLRLNALERDNRLQLFDRPAGTGASSTIALDSLAASLYVPCVVKVDVEGGEVDVLTGARELLRRPGVAWIIETHSAALERDCMRIFGTHGLDVRIVSPAWWRIAIPEARPIPHNRWLVASPANPT